VVWLLSGSDEKIHMFREDQANHCYSEVNVADYFPELAEPPSIILWLDIYHCKNEARYEIHLTLRDAWICFKLKKYQHVQSNFKHGM
jgi:hypothetical protein